MEAAEADPRASGIEFLALSDRAWKLLFSNSVAHENRLRAAEHCRLIERGGFRIISKQCSVRQQSLEKLKTMRVAPCFAGFSPEELAIDMLWVVAQKPA